MPASFQSDLFSLGLILYFIATGEHVFDGKQGAMKILMKMMTGERPPLLKTAHPSIAQLIACLWAPNEAQRPFSGEAVLTTFCEARFGIVEGVDEAVVRGMCSKFIEGLPGEPPLDAALRENKKLKARLARLKSKLAEAEEKIRALTPPPSAPAHGLSLVRDSFAVPHTNIMREWLPWSRRPKFILKCDTDSEAEMAELMRALLEQKVKNSLIIVQSKGGSSICGCFRAKRWSVAGYGHYNEDDPAAFLFTLKNRQGTPPTKFPFVKGGAGCVCGRGLMIGNNDGQDDANFLIQAEGIEAPMSFCSYRDVLGLGVGIFTDDGSSNKFEYERLELWHISGSPPKT